MHVGGEFYRDTYGNGPYPDEPYNSVGPGHVALDGVESYAGYETPIESLWRRIKTRFFPGPVTPGHTNDGSLSSGVIADVPDVSDISKFEVEENGEPVTPIGFMDLPVFQPPQGVYLVYGRPGCGKTVFSAACVDRLLCENQGLFQHTFIYVPGIRPEWTAISKKHKNVTTLSKVRPEMLGKIIQNQKDRYVKNLPNKIMIILDDQMGQGQGIHAGPIGDLIDRIAASNRQPELNIVFFVLAQHVSFIPPSMRLTARMIAYSQPTDDSLDAILGAQGIQCNKDEIKAYAQANQFVVVDCWTSKVYATKSYHLQ